MMFSSFEDTFPGAGAKHNIHGEADQMQTSRLSKAIGNAYVIALGNGHMHDRIIYAIADVHGRADLLKKTIDYVEADARFYGKTPHVYFLGDIVDRGPESMQALDIVADTLKRLPGSVFHLGNHDNWFLDAIDTKGTGPEVQDWEHHGGLRTASSYAPELKCKHALMWIKGNRPDHVDLIRNARLITDHGRIAFCHAGIDPRLPLSEQDKDVLTWIRVGFLEHVSKDMPVIVHGHTIFDHGPMVTENRISLDTGAFRTDKLTTCRIFPAERSITFFQALGRNRMVDMDEIEPRLIDRGHGTVLDRLDEIFDNWKPSLFDNALEPANG
jgi:serine/threonine protein phosphatase 1